MPSNVDSPRRVYVKITEFCELTPWTPDAVEKLIQRGYLKPGVHFFQPFGPRTERLFKWPAIQALVEGVEPTTIDAVEETSYRRDFDYGVFRKSCG